MYRALICACLLVAAPAPATAQAPSNNASQNPGISFVGDARALMGEGEDDLRFELEGLEVAGQGWLNPYARADIFVGFHEGEAEIEEAFVTFTALPGGLSVRGGRFLVDQGRFASQHIHTFNFVEMPRYVQQLFGEEGFQAVGANPSLLFGAGDVAITLSGSILDAAEGHAHAGEDSTHGGEEGEEPRALDQLTYTGRASAFLELDRDHSLEFAAGGGTRVDDPDEDLRSTWFGGDFKYRWRPDARRSATLQAEILQATVDHEGGEQVDALGFFANAEAQFARRWVVGAFGESAEALEEGEGRVDAFGAYLNWFLFEESTILRLVARHDQYEDDAIEDETSAVLQLVWSLGPHQPHRF